MGPMVRLFGRASPAGTLYLGAMADSGRWWVSSDRLCHKWNRWLNSEPQCLRLQKEGQLIRWWTEDGTSGTALITQPAFEVDATTKLHILKPETTTTPVVAVAAPATQLPADGTTGIWHSSTSAQLPAAQQPAPIATPSTPRTQAKAAAEPKRPADLTYVVANVEPDDVLNARSGPSTEFDVIGELAPGSRGVSITGACRSGWCPVQHRAASGWVNRTYLTLDAAVLTHGQPDASEEPQGAPASVRDPVDAPRTCLTSPTRAPLGSHRGQVRTRQTRVDVPAWCRDRRHLAAVATRERQCRGLRWRCPQSRDRRVADRQPSRGWHHDLRRHEPYSRRYRSLLRVDRGWAALG